MGKVFFTSDTHFGSKRTLELSKRPFENVEDMDESIISNWNNKVNKKDIVYHLGDFGDYNVVEKLNGNIVLIFGNYEERDIIERYDNNELAFITDLISKGFSDVRSTYYYKDIHLTHKPTDCINGRFNLFGHIHKLQMVKEFGLNVGVDAHNFTPVDLDTVNFYKNGIKQHYDEDVFIRELI